MRRPSLFRPLAATLAVALLVLGLGPARAATLDSKPRPVAVATHAKLAKHLVLEGTLVALNAQRLTGDLALKSGNLIPLRFASRAQEKGLRVGQHLKITGQERRHARVLVRTVRVSGAVHAWRMKGVIVRLLPHNRAEVRGLNGAAVIVNLDKARITRPRAARPHHAELLSVGVASADAGTRFSIGMAIDCFVSLTRGNVTSVTTVQIVATHVVQTDLEGQVISVNLATHILVVQDENGLTTSVDVGVQVAQYKPGDEAECTYVPTDSNDASGSATGQEDDGSNTGDNGNGGDNGNTGGDSTPPCPCTCPPGATETTVPVTSTPTVTQTATPVAGDQGSDTTPSCSASPEPTLDQNGETSVDVSVHVETSVTTGSTPEATAEPTETPQPSDTTGSVQRP